MCQSSAEGGKRCEYADMLANVRRKARYKYRDSHGTERQVTKALNKWKEEHPEIVREHLPETMPFQYKPKERPVPKALLNMLTPSSRTPVTGASTPEEREQQVAAMHKAYKEWEDRLTTEEINSVSQYTMSSFGLINAVMRKSGFDDAINRYSTHRLGREEKDRIRDRTKQTIRNLKAAFKKSTRTAEPRRLYRFFRVPAGVTPQEFVERYMLEGDGFCDGAFMSTTADPEFIMAHMHDRNKGTRNKGYVVMEILTKQGQSLQPHEATSSGHVQSLENEVLLPPNTKLRVVGVNKVQQFEYGSDRMDLYQHYNFGASHSNRHFMFKQYGHHSQGDRLNFPMVKLNNI